MNAKLAFFWIARLLGAFRIARWITRRGTRVLCYHATWRAPIACSGDAMFIRPETFRRRMNAIQRLGFPVVSLDNAVASLARGARDYVCPVVITIDDGWYGTFADMLPILSALRCPATLYSDTQHLLDGLPIAHVMANYLDISATYHQRAVLDPQVLSEAKDQHSPMSARLSAAERLAEALGIDPRMLGERKAFSYMSPDELRRFAGSFGTSVELHTHSHSLHDHSPSRIEDEIRENRGVLAALLDREPETFRHFCYPSGDIAPGDAVILRALGIQSATTTRPGLAFTSTDLFAIPRILDGDHMTDLEFEAELSGFAHLLRTIVRRSAPGST